ncbi:hypothetical protein BKA67DRAFT_166188 [Truncatella angustata]|uniref:Uncharacterized protein n=1 Tax=Truncatella angustata TaxID=152316 RepID=A0A9P8URJ4_9PEZI|nr:uncharacterized protein BKA67DRAFT_166188 [Truncatella angustata]KAH6656730.1 hypothetical protein BKA67DRAFT_166188 [Truncatella angustata]
MTADGPQPLRSSDDNVRQASRFQEGSMNDRASAAPPVQFLGPEEAAEFERQFYQTHAAPDERNQQAAKRNRSVSTRRDRPLSAQAPVQNLPHATTARHASEEQEQATHKSEEAQSVPTQRRPGFLGRVREAIFGKPNASKPDLGRVQSEMDKRTSLQQPPRHLHSHHQARPIPIPIQGGGMHTKSHSEACVPQLPASFHSSGFNMNDRPSREEIMASYNQLMATGFFKAHAIQSTRQPAPGTSVPNMRQRAGPTLPTIPSPDYDRPSLDQAPKRPSFTLIPASPSPSPRRMDFSSPPVPSSLPPPPPIFSTTHQVKPKPSWESFRKGLRGRKRARADCSDDNASESASMVSQQLPYSSTSTQIATQVTGIGRRVSKKLRKMPSALASQLQAKSDGLIRMVPAGADSAEMRSATRRSLSPGRPGSSGGRTLRKRGDRARPPVALNNYPHLDPARTARAQQSHSVQPSDNWEPMDVDGGISSDRVSLDSVRQEHVSYLLSDGVLGVPSEPLGVMPDMNRSFPPVPQASKHRYKHGGMSADENSSAQLWIGQAL